MKNFFLVSVAIGIFSGTTLTAKAQPSINIEQVNAANTAQKKSAKFIEGIEFKTITATPVKAVEKSSKKAETKNEESAAIES